MCLGWNITSTLNLIHLICKIELIITPWQSSLKGIRYKKHSAQHNGRNSVILLIKLVPHKVPECQSTKVMVFVHPQFGGWGCGGSDGTLQNAWAAGGAYFQKLWSISTLSLSRYFPHCPCSHSQVSWPQDTVQRL